MTKTTIILFWFTIISIFIWGTLTTLTILHQDQEIEELRETQENTGGLCPDKNGDLRTCCDYDKYPCEILILTPEGYKTIKVDSPPLTQEDN